MSEELKEEHIEHAVPGRSRPSRSLFGPIVLIAIGVYFLLRNLGVISDVSLHWQLALQLWPLLLIFAGFNVLVRQLPRPFGSLLSGFVALTAVLVFGVVLLFGAEIPVVNRLNLSETGEVRREQIKFAGDGVTAAVVDIDFGLPSGDVFTLEDSSDLIAGSVSYMGDLVFDTSQDGGKATVHLGTDDFNGWFFLNPSNWVNFDATDRWQIGLNPDVMMDLGLDIGAGSVNLELSDLSLSRLDINGGAGSMKAWLPGGDYDAKVDIGAGSLEMTLPGDGRHKIEVDGGAGSMTFYLSPNMAARLEVESGAGGLYLDDNRFMRISGENNDGVWETPGYEDAANRVNLVVDIGAGSLRVKPVAGR